jgi:hypothetical protein
MTDCEICGGEGSVCEDHPWVAWDEGQGCCGGGSVRVCATRASRRL